MNPVPENVEGRLVRSHSFEHSVQHRVNWSHVLVALVVIALVVRFGPTVVQAVSE